MSKRRDDDLFDTLSETKRLVGELEMPVGEEFSLESILAEFGQDAAEPAPKREVAPPVPEPEEEIPAPEEPKEVPTPQEEFPEEAPACEEEMTHDPAPKEEPKPRRAKVLQFPRLFARGEEGMEPEEEPAPEKAPVPEPEPEPAAQPAPEPEPLVSIEDVMARTVDAVLEDESDAILEERPPLTEQIGFWWANVKEKAQELLGQFAPAGKKVSGGGEAVPQWEPDMEQAFREAKRRCKRLGRHLLFSAIPMVLLLALTVVDTWWAEYLPEVWHEMVLLRCGVVGGLLLLTCLLAIPVWREALQGLKEKQINCEIASALPVLAVLGECIYGAVTGKLIGLPLAAPAALLVWLCLLGRLLLAKAQRDAFRLADLGGRPPYAVSVTSAGACKQKGRIDGFYTAFQRPDPAAVSQNILLPLLLAVCTVLAGVVCIGGERMEEFLHVWSALLTAALPLGLPLCGSLSVYCLQKRLVRSGCAVAGYAGARAVGDAKRMVLTDNDLFPPGTVSLNGLKIYGEEIGKVASYAATVARASGSQLQPIFEQLLAAEGGTHCPYDDLHFYEEGGVGITIRGESVTMGSEYFMKKHRVRLPQELKVKTGVFLAVDGQLIAIFAIKYQPSRNVEWALRALRRSRMEPVLAVRGGNITPGLLKKRFSVDAKPVYPDISTRLALSDLSGETALQANAVVYREGLMPFAETVIGSRRCCRAVRRSTLLCWLGSLSGLLLAYYLTGIAAYSALSAGYVLVFVLLWLLPAVLLGDLTRRY